MCEYLNLPAAVLTDDYMHDTICFRVTKSHTRLVGEMFHIFFTLEAILKDKFTQKCKFCCHLLTSTAMESQAEFRSPQNISCCTAS